MIPTDELKRMREAALKGTKVVAWYPHPEDGTVRGPFCRWLQVSEVQPEYRQHVAHKFDEVEFVAAALNNFLPLLNEIDRAREEIEVLRQHQVSCGEFFVKRHSDKKFWFGRRGGEMMVVGPETMEKIFKEHM